VVVGSGSDRGKERRRGSELGEGARYPRYVSVHVQLHPRVLFEKGNFGIQDSGSGSKSILISFDFRLIFVLFCLIFV
jgi:hypothetical protein